MEKVRRCALCEHKRPIEEFTYFPGRGSYRAYCGKCYNSIRRAQTLAKSRGIRFTVPIYRKILTKQKQVVRTQVIATKIQQLTEQQLAYRRDWF